MQSKLQFFAFTHGKGAVNLLPGTYKIECWGAEGGAGLDTGVAVRTGGKGAYVSGILTINKELPLYIFVGGKGGDASPIPNTKATGGFNGGGIGGADVNDDDASGGGGGATDVRLLDGNWDDEKSLLSRIIVASGGSGSVSLGYGAPGGAIYGYRTIGMDQDQFYIVTDINQTSGYKLGIGENGADHRCTPASGAGGGYWGGKSSVGSCENQYFSVSSSGSSFISGNPDCIAIDSQGKSVETSNHYSNIFFTETEMKSGLDTFLSPFNMEEKGHSGDGAIKITLLKLLSTYIHNFVFLPNCYLFFVAILLK